MNTDSSLPLAERLVDEDTKPRNIEGLCPFRSMIDGKPYQLVCREGEWRYLEPGKLFGVTLFSKCLHEHPNREVVLEFRRLRNELVGWLFEEEDARDDAQLFKSQQMWHRNGRAKLWLGMCLAIILASVGWAWVAYA